MSIATMVALGVERGSETATSESRSRGEQGKVLDSAMEKISAFIPSEIIGIYVAGFGVLSPDSDAAKWWIFGVCFALIPLLVWLNYLERKKRTGGTLTVKITAVLLLFAMIAFVAWAAALPGTPFLAFTTHATAIGGWAVVILAVVMYKIADVLDIVPSEGDSNAGA